MNALHTMIADAYAALDTLFYVAAAIAVAVVGAWVFATVRFNRRLRAQQQKGGRA